MTEQIVLQPKTENAPAKTKDAGVIRLVKEGKAAYNAKSGELLLLPAGERERRELSGRLRETLFAQAGAQVVDCGRDAGILSLAERYLREWGDAATLYAEERGRTIGILGWSENEARAQERAERVRSAVSQALSTREATTAGARLRFIEETTTDGRSLCHLAAPAEAGSLHVRPGFACAKCGALLLPDTPVSFAAAQPGAAEPEEPLEDIETPGANTIAELCSQLGLEMERTLKAMLYVAFDAQGQVVPVASFVRGDYNVSLTKLSAWLARERSLTGLRSADKAELYDLVGEVAGYCGPVGMPETVVVVCDGSVRGARNVVVGANKPGYHKKGCCYGRDFEAPIADIAQCTSGMPCPCGAGVLEAVALRDAGVLGFGLNSMGKPLAYRDREGAHEYPVEIRGSFSLEAILLAQHDHRYP